MTDIVSIQYDEVVPFTIISHEISRSPSLSWKAKGLLCNLLSHSNGFKLSTKKLISQATDGRDSTLAGLAELQRTGYLSIRRERGAGGRFVRITWVIRRAPMVRGTLNPETDRGDLSQQSPNSPQPEIPVVDANRDCHHKRVTRNPAEPARKEETTVQEETTTTAGSDVVLSDEDGIEQLVLPGGLSEKQTASVFACLQKVKSSELHQPLLDELAGALEAGKVQSTVAWFREVCLRADTGSFEPLCGSTVADRRSAAKAADVEARAKADLDQARRAKLARDRLDPAEQLRIRGHFEEVAQILGRRPG